MGTREKIRVAFTFDEQSLAGLEEIQKDGNYSCFAETVRDSLQINRALQIQAKNGYNEIILRHSKTGDERVLVIPSLQSFYRECK